MFKKISYLVLGLVAVLGLAACSDLNANVNGYYVAVDINPSIEFVVDEDDNVESFIFLNEDAEILCADLDFTGMNIDDAVELFVQTATEAGYIDPEGEENAVLITVIGEEGDEEAITGIRERIRERLIKHFGKQFINATVLTEEFTQEDLLAQAEALGVTPGKLKLALAAQLGDDTLVLEELLELPVKDILALVREFHGEAWQEFKTDKMDEYKEKKEALMTQHRERLENYIAEHPELTEEEIQAIYERAQSKLQETQRNRWQERVDRWNQNREERQNNNECTEECTNDEV